MGRTLLIDHRDSYTYNIVDILSEINGEPPTVVTMDSEMPLAFADFDNVVLSPGPGNPYCASDLGITPKVVQAACDRGVPVFGICMGHQALCVRHGKKVVKRTPAHGRISEVCLTDEGRSDPLLRGLPSRFNVVRYHSLGSSMDHEEESEDIIPLGYTLTESTSEGNLLQIFRVRGHPLWGVQFHPESVLTAHGVQILRNFCAFSLERKNPPLDAPAERTKSWIRPRPRASSRPEPAPTIRHRCIPGTFDVESIFAMLGENAFWLDATKTSGRRFSFLGSGALNGPEAFELSYYLTTKTLFDSRTAAADARTGATRSFSSSNSPSSSPAKVASRKVDNFFDFFDGEMSALKARIRNDPGLPFEMQCGFVGYFGYEMKAESVTNGGGAQQHTRGSTHFLPPQQARAGTPDAYWRFVDRQIVVGSGGTELWLVGLDADDTDLWMDEWEQRLLKCPKWEEEASNTTLLREPFVPSKERQEYIEAINQCLGAIHEGESYELCLTTQLTSPQASTDARAAYRRLRRENPAPFGAYLDVCGADHGNGHGLNGHGPVDVTRSQASVLSSSPERFLKIDDGWAEVKPIKGTIRRGVTKEEDEANRLFLATDEKCKAENLMIVDLMRNDLSTVCVAGTVHCPNLMDVEAHPSVFQLVSTVRGFLEPHITIVRAVQRCFPAGSMTGAPKLRSMQILERLEGEPRGIYSGCLGFMTPTNCDLSVVIRTVVVTPESLHIGAGGAIIAMSDPEAEWDEMLLKTRAPVKALTNPLPPLPSNRSSAPDRPLLVPSSDMVPQTNGAQHLGGHGARTCVINDPRYPFHIFETLRVDTMGDGRKKIWFPDEHYDRLQASCKFFSITCPHKDAFLADVERAAIHSSSRVHYNTGGVLRAADISTSAPPVWCFPSGAQKRNDDHDHDHDHDHDPDGEDEDERRRTTTITFSLDSTSTATDCLTCFHKTTDRSVYDAASARMEKSCAKMADDVLLYNIRGEITEFTIGNFCMETAEGWVTPPLRSGLLLGILRNHLVASGALKERVVTVHDLLESLESPARFARINSVRGVEVARLVTSSHAPAFLGTNAAYQSLCEEPVPA